MPKPKLIRITTVPISLEKLLENQLKFMKAHYDVIAVSADATALERVGKLQEVAVFPVEMTRKITPLKDIKSLWKMYSFLKKEKPEIVHSHTPKAGIIGMLAARLAGVPLRLHTVAGLPLLETSGKKRKLLAFVEKLTYSCATGVYPNSKGLKAIIEAEKFCAPEKLKVIGEGSSNGIDTEYFNPEHFSAGQNVKFKGSLDIENDDFVFIFIGRLVGDKGINELIAAFTKLKKAKTKLLLVGAAENDLDPLSTQTLEILSKGNEHNIISVGYQSDVRPYLAISDVLVFPSYREGFPNVVLQAGAMGIPAIVSDINGCNEIITEGQNGIIIPVKNADAIYDAMKSIIENQDYCATLKTNARPMIVSKYEQKIIWSAILEEYKRLEKNLDV